MSHKLRILYAADLHGSIAHYHKLLSATATRKADCLVIGGDLLPGGKSLAPAADAQKRFIIDHLRPLFKEFREANRGKTIYLMMGNDDFAVNMDRLEEMESDGLVKLLHLRAHPLSDSLFVAGYGCVPPTFFLIKDWERLDVERAAVPVHSYQACSSTANGIEAVDAREWFLSHNTISEDLETLARLSDPASTVYVIHAPPYATKLDVLHSGHHAGSRSVRSFIEKYAPPLTLHGHIHESHYMTKKTTDRIGSTICINAGQTAQALHAVTIDMIGKDVRKIISFPGSKAVL
ncbi:MAG: metallophosphoesterase [Syntrophorhabdus aromaticivorans]|uniref:Metallophosphoesterase n=2 Tax=Syntrophorhabdus aromaticivorans TaxID=328301 RepID=A0A971M501_9BACT|nr:metallophosphoesterase [Syntrophorhabdus aromaticivorans]